MNKRQAFANFFTENCSSVINFPNVLFFPLLQYDMKYMCLTLAVSLEQSKTRRSVSSPIITIGDPDSAAATIAVSTIRRSASF